MCFVAVPFRLGNRQNALIDLAGKQVGRVMALRAYRWRQVQVLTMTTVL